MKGEYLTVQGVPLKLPPLNFIRIRCHVNWPAIYRSVRGYTGILYLDNFRGGGFSGTPCISLTSSKYGYSTEQFLHGVCTARAAEPVWRDGGVAGETEEGGALRGTRLVDGGALVE